MKETPQPPVIKETEESPQAKPQNLEAYLRESIFGDEFRDYNEKLEKLTQELENAQQSIVEMETRLLKEITAVKEQYGDIPEDIAQRVDNRIDELISRSENDLEKLSMLINEFATDFQAQIDGLHTETQKLQNDGQSDRQVLANALITIGTQLKKES